MPRGIFVPVDRTGIPAERETGEGQKRSGTHTMETGCGWEWRRCCAPFLRRGCWSLPCLWTPLWPAFPMAPIIFGCHFVRWPASAEFAAEAWGSLCLWAAASALICRRGSCLGFLLLAGLGIVKIFDSSLKALIRRHRDLHRQWQFSAFHFRVILNIYANPEQADQDRSGVLSVGEATALAVALSLDSLTVGVGWIRRRFSRRC